MEVSEKIRRKEVSEDTRRDELCGKPASMYRSKSRYSGIWNGGTRERYIRQAK